MFLFLVLPDNHPEKTHKKVFLIHRKYVLGAETDLLQVIDSSPEPPESMYVARLLNPAGMESHWSKRTPLPSEYEPAAHDVHCCDDISKNSPASQEKA